jgi:tetratricopeptide (TPR) repeat protein
MLTYRAAAVCLALASLAGAQTMMTLPEASQQASVSQRLGVTEITIQYHRPLVGGRNVWGGLVPYGQVWRAGANENTTFQVSDPVTVEGKPLPAGTYGLHMMPGADSWEIIFSKNSTSWGSFTYDKAEDALRVTVKPQPTDFHEALTYDFDAVKPDSAVVTLRWEKLAVPFSVAIDTTDVSLRSLRRELRGGKQYSWSGWDEAANFCLQHKTNLEEGLHWADLSIQNEERFENTMTKAGLLEALNRGSDAKASYDRAMKIGNATQIYFFGRQMQAEKRDALALSTFGAVATRFPDLWVGHLAQARVDSAAGKFDDATKHLQAALASGAVPEASKTAVEGYLKKAQAGQDFNR